MPPSAFTLTRRDTAATYLLRAGVDIVTISHWLGHASIETTNRYLALNLEARRDAAKRAGPLGASDPNLRGWKSDATILDWLEALWPGSDRPLAMLSDQSARPRWARAFADQLNSTGAST